jgi:hypothetical protein
MEYQPVFQEYPDELGRLVQLHIVDMLAKVMQARALVAEDR